MKIAILLEELISISQASKTDFAISMNMTPSGLSKILTGKRLPSTKEKTTFSIRSARYFAEKIYGYKCHLKFKNIFSIIYDFSSCYELELFLTHAIDYALDNDFMETDNRDKENQDKESSYLGKKTVLNMLCIIISDFALQNKGILSEYYSTIPLINQVYSDIFCRVEIFPSKNPIHNSFNQYLNIDSLHDNYNLYDKNLFSYISSTEQYSNLILWRIDESFNDYFLLCKGKYVLLFSIQMYGVPMMNFITNKVYVSMFFNYISKKDATKISYNRDEAIALLTNNPEFVPNLIKREIHAVYNFISIGYMIENHDLANIPCPIHVKNNILEFFNAVLENKTKFFVTIDAMTGFYSTGNAIVPLIGAVNIPENQRTTYLERFNPYINKKGNDKIKIINSEQPKLAVICFKALSIIYCVDETYKFDKFHFIETDKIEEMLHNIIGNNFTEILDFSVDMWESFTSNTSKLLSDMIKNKQL